LLRLLSAFGHDEIDLVAFTSASQASNPFTVAQHDGKQASLKQSLGRTLVASIGPLCSVALRKLAVGSISKQNRRSLGRLLRQSTRRCPTRVFEPSTPLHARKSIGGSALSRALKWL
jgi:uroporphyrinogen-III synthase